MYRFSWLRGSFVPNETYGMNITLLQYLRDENYTSSKINVELFEVHQS